jgi:Spy/CpxP family protein refolding chaperone
VLVRRITMLTILAALASFHAAVATAAEAAPAAAAPAQLPPWVTPDLIKATQAINLTPEQNAKFEQVVGDYVTAHFGMIAKVNKMGQPNIDMTIRSKDKALVHQMDDQMKGVITEAQWPAYEDYKKVLKDGLKP